MRATKNTITRNELVFFRIVFLSPEIDCFFPENRQQSGQKKHMFFLVMRGLNLMRALI